MNSKIIALSAVSASITAVLLTLGAYIQFVDLVSVVIASVFVVLPLYYKSFLGAVLAYLAGGLIALIFYGFNIYSLVFPAYFAFFGIFPIIKKYMAVKNLKMQVAFAINLIWFEAVAFGLYFYYTSLMGMPIDDLPQIIADNILIAVGVVAVAFFIVFDRFVMISQLVTDKYLYKILK